MKYYVVSKFDCFIAGSSQLRIGSEKSWYFWKTPYTTKEEAEKAMAYLKTASRACEITIEEITS